MLQLIIKSCNFGSKKYKSQKALALPTNIRLGWKGLPGTNALTYYEKSLSIKKAF